MRQAHVQPIPAAIGCDCACGAPLVIDEPGDPERCSVCTASAWFGRHVRGPGRAQCPVDRQTPWRATRRRLGRHTLTLAEYRAVEPHLGRPLTDPPISALRAVS